MIDLDTIGYFLFMEEQERKEQERSQEEQENRNCGNNGIYDRRDSPAPPSV